MQTPSPLSRPLLHVANDELHATEQTLAYDAASAHTRIPNVDNQRPTGTLVPRGHLDLQGAPGAMAHDPKRQLLYVSVGMKSSVAVLAIDPVDGQLRLRSSASIPSPVYLTTDRQGRYLLMAYFTAGK